jgi:hypothetical protein
MVFDEPPAPAARDEFGFDTVEVAARRLVRSAGKHGNMCKQNFSSEALLNEFTGWLHQEAWLLQTMYDH